MKTYAEKEFAAQERGRKSGDGAGARHLGEPELDEPENVSRGWQRQADRIGRDREWNFPMADAVPEWITLLPGWQESGVVLAIRSDAYSRHFPEQRAEADVVSVFKDGNHYWALLNGEKVWVPGDGNCFFYAVWTALNVPEHAEAARKIFRGSVPETPQAASDYFRGELRAYALQHPEYAEIFGEGEEDFVDASDSGPRKPEMGEASEPSGGTSGDERDSQSDLGTEVKRTLFHLGNDTAAFVGQAAATTLMHRTLAAVLPFPLLFSALGYGASVFNLLAALRRRNLVEGLIQTLLLLPYHVLSPHNLLFAVAEQTKRFIDKEMGGHDEASQGEHTGYLAENIYMTVGLILFLAHFGYLYGERVEQPGTRVGRPIAAIPRAVNRIVQAYSIVEKIVSAKPRVDLAVIVEPTCDALGYSIANESVLTKAEKQTQKLERAERRAKAAVMREGARERLKQPSHDKPTLAASRPEVPTEQAHSPGGTARPQGGLIASLLAGVVGLWVHQGSGGAEMIPLQDVLAQRADEAVIDGADVGAHAETALMDAPAGVVAANAVSRVRASRWPRRHWIIAAFVFGVGLLVALWKILTGASGHAGSAQGPNRTSGIANMTGDTTAVASDPTTVTNGTVYGPNDTGSTTNETQVSVEDIFAGLSEIVSQIEFVDVGEDPEFSGLFSNVTGVSRKRRAVAQSSTNADLVGEYLDRLESLFLEDPVLYQFFSNLVVDLKPIILTKKSVMARLGDDYAVLIELDTMLLAMQEFIIDKQFSIEDYKNFHGLLLINEARNGLVRDLQNRYGDKAVPYYKILSRRKGFVLIEKFWAESFIEKYLKVLMKEEGVNHHLMNTRLQVLKDLKMDDSFLIAYRRQTALGFVGERRMIKALIEAVQFRLTFWVSEQRRDSRLGIASLDLTNRIQITNHEDMKNYLLGLAKKVKNKNRSDFSYPVERADYIEGEFVSDRINEILKYENGANEHIIISHYYNDTVKIESSSMREIALGEHKRHPLYTKNSTKIKWPATITKEQQEALPVISDEIELSGVVLKSVMDMNEAQSLLVRTRFVNIIEFTEDDLRDKAKELNITEPIYFNTTVEHEVTDMGEKVTAVSGGRKLKSTVQLGEIALGHLGRRHLGGFISSSKLNELAVGRSVIDSLKNSTRTIQIRGGVNLIYENEVFYYSPQQNTDLVAISSTIYGDSTQRNRLGEENGLVIWSQPGAPGRTDHDRPPQNALVKKGTRLRLPNFYHVESGDTLRKVAQTQLGNEAYARQIGLINIGVNGFVLSGIVKDVDGLKSIEKPLEQVVDLDAEIEFGTTIIIPMKIQLNYDLFAHRSDEVAYQFLAKKFYLYESKETKNKLREWNRLKILQAQVGHDDSGTPGTFYDYIAPL